MDSFNGERPFGEGGTDVFTHQTAAYQNRLRVLHLICRRECLSQRQLALKTKLRTSTISNIIRDLSGIGLLREGMPIEDNRVGPKERELEIVPGAAWSAGLSLHASGHRLLVLNAMGHVITQESFHSGISLDELIHAMPKRVAAIADQFGLSRIPLAGVGVSAPGVVNAESGEILVSRSLNLRSRPLRAELEKVLSCPVWVERNVNCGAYAEHHIGVTRERDSFFYFLLQSQPGRNKIFGLSLMINQRIFRGSNSAAGEVSQDLLPTLAADSPLQQNEAEIDAFYLACATVLSGITNLFDIGCVVLCSDDQHLTPQRFETMRANVIKGLIPVPGRRLDFFRSTLSVDGMMLGAALLALHRHLAGRLGERDAGGKGQQSQKKRLLQKKGGR
ncbi:MAG TPA: ROK family protein [Candidatus Methylacidiphilales bacterium]